MRDPTGFPTGLRGGRLLIAAVLAILLALLLARVVAAAYVEILWQREAGYLSVFWRRMVWQWGARLLAGGSVTALVYINLRAASRNLGAVHIRRRFGNIEIAEKLPQRWVSIILLAVSSVLGFWFGAAVPASLGTQVLALAHAEAWGVREPILGHDLSFYVFALPVLGSLVTFGLVVTFLLFTLATAGYAATGALRWGRGRIEATDGTRMHLSGLIAVFFVLVATRFWLERYFLLLAGTSDVQGIFGFTDAEARLPGLHTLTVIALGAAIGIAWGGWRNRLATIAASVIAVLMGAGLIGQLYPRLVQSFRVEPNELDRETPFIEHNLRFTRVGFGLDDLDRRTFIYAEGEAVDWEVAARQIEGVPMWSRDALLETFRAVEARFPYYDFAEVSLDRYQGPSGPVPMAVSVREVEPEGIQDPNWQNRHLREVYLRGMGAVASLAGAGTPEGRPAMLLSGIPPESAPGAEAFSDLGLARPAVYFGTRPQPYAVINPSGGEFLSPDSTPGVAGRDFPRGIELGSTLRKALLAWRFRDANLLLAAEVDAGSQFVYRRRVVERALAIAPFLRFPEPPYPVITGGRVVWVLEGFTGTRAFPLSTAADFGAIRSPVTYVRNSVKVTVDGITGEMHLFRVPLHDPLADAYSAAFPGLFEPMTEMPLEIRAHVRYPRELLSMQARVLLQYHQETAESFHGQSDVWDTPQEFSQGTSPVPYTPEYAIYTLPGDQERHFYLSTVFVPAGRQNLTGILAGRVDELGVPVLRLLDIPLADQVPGPRQIEALAEQDPLISQQFSLWRSGGSEVWTGHLHLLPVGRRVVFVEPVFLAASEDAIPELRRYLISEGRRVVLAEDVRDALSALGGGQELPASAVGGLTGGGLVGGESEWPRAALSLLERAEERARLGDWQGFGVALRELRRLLEEIGGSGEVTVLPPIHPQCPGAVDRFPGRW